jgi:hypothetical protein
MAAEVLPAVIYIIGVGKNSGQGKGCANPDQTFLADFNELLFIYFNCVEADRDPGLILINQISRDALPIIRKNFPERGAAKRFPTHTLVRVTCVLESDRIPPGNRVRSALV